MLIWHSQLRRLDIPVAAASRTEAPDLARQMLKLLRISSSTGTEKAIDFFSHLQIYPGSKTRHFQRLHAETGIAYDEMLFFDDESRNRDVEGLGVVMWLVRDGVTKTEVDEGIRSWRKRNKKVRDGE
jgi:magnesium-dependent phosphatase 1